MPALYFTNLISARPLMGPAGAGSLAQVVNAAIAEQGALRRRCATSSTASAAATRAGVWEDTPRDRPEFREQYERKLVRQAKARKAEEMG